MIEACSSGFRVARIEAFVLSAPLRQPRRNAFGVMHARPALLLRVILDDGAEGFGEAFANWPAFGAPHRARIVEEVLAPVASGRDFSSPAELWQTLDAKTRSLAIQCGEAGPFAQAIAAVEIAVCDALARRAGEPLWRALGGKVDVGRRVRAYASGLTAETIDRLVPPLRDAGWTAFKLKVGFGQAEDRRALDRLLDLIGPGSTVMVDANQAWSVDGAMESLGWLRDYRLGWIEEPISAEAPFEDVRRICAATDIDIAAGENIRGDDAFARALHAGVGVLQPDPIKWGGLTGCLRVAGLAQGRARFAPHCLCSAVGTAATVALAIAGGADLMEIDVTDNPLRSELWRAEAEVRDGFVVPTDRPGCGVDPSVGFLSQWSAGSSQHSM